MEDDDIAERWRYLVTLDDELLVGGVILTEWCAFIVRETDQAFAAGANLAAILTAVSAIETYLRAELEDNKSRLVELIDNAVLEHDLKDQLQELRRYRNRWVHVDRPNDDQVLLERPAQHEQELCIRARDAMRLVRRTIYSDQAL